MLQAKTQDAWASTQTDQGLGFVLDSMIVHAISEETDQTWLMSRPLAEGFRYWKRAVGWGGVANRINAGPLAGHRSLSKAYFISIVLPCSGSFIFELRHDKTCLREFPTRPDTNQPA